MIIPGLQSYTFVKTVNIGGNISIGPICISDYLEVKWFRDYSYLIAHWSPHVVYTNRTNLKIFDYNPCTLNICYASLEDAGNYTLEISKEHGSSKHQFLLVVNHTSLTNGGITLQQQTFSDALRLCHSCYLIFVPYFVCWYFVI
uniref:Glycoprotein vIgFam7 n=1 Tax=Elephant endotheliotropic herpesvirus 1A TaxID=759753 RepID=A0A866VTD4_ELHV1|nr:glycoprotein vIgFam7 [Elephant endotheliotropic herpesvirus 1A]